MWYVYVLQSEKDNNWYTGYTDNLKKRFEMHNKGLVFASRKRRPFNLIYYEASLHEDDAKARELYLKSGMGKRFIRNRLKYYFAEKSLTGTANQILQDYNAGVAARLGD